MKRLVIIAALMAALAGCGEKPQALATSARDVPAHMGTGSAFTAPGWTAGDKSGWEQQLKARQQNSQNDYSRMN